MGLLLELRSPTSTPVTLNPSALSPYGQLLNSNLTFQAKSTSGTTKAECRATAAAPSSQSQFEATVSALATSGGGFLLIGVDDGTWDCAVDDSAVPGLSGEGVCLQYSSGGVEIDRNGSGVRFLDPPPALTANDTISVAIDKGGTVTFYLMRSGSQISNFGGAVSWTPPTGSDWYAWVGFAGAGGTVDCKFGSGQVRTLDTGFSYYDAGGATTISATGSPSLNSFTSTSSATIKVKAVGAAAPNTFATASAATVKVKAAGSGGPNSFTSAAADKILVHGAGLGIISAFTSSSVAAVKIKATGPPAPNSFTTTSAAKILVKAVAAPSINAFVSAAASKALVEGFGSGVLNSFAASSAAKVIVKAVASPALDTFTISATADLISNSITASAFAITFDPFISEAAARGLVDGVGSGTINAFTSDAAADVRIRGIGIANLAAFSSTAAATVRVVSVASITFGGFTLSATLRRVVPAPVPANRTTQADMIARTRADGRPSRTTFAERRTA